MSNAATGPTKVEGARRGVAKAFCQHSVLDGADDCAIKEMAYSGFEQKHFALVVSVLAHALSLFLLFIFNTSNVLNDYTMAYDNTIACALSCGDCYSFSVLAKPVPVAARKIRPHRFFDHESIFLLVRKMLHKVLP